MVSRIYLEFNKYSEKRNSRLSRYKHKDSANTDSNLFKTFSTPQNESESTQISPMRYSRKYLEIRRISYQSIRPKPPPTIDSPNRILDTSMKPRTPSRPQSIKSERNISISPKKKPIRRFKTDEKLPIDTYDPLPTSEAKTYYNERIKWKKRKNGNLPLCLINFNGVLGDYTKSFWSYSDGEFSMVEGIKPGLKLLSSDFYIIIISWYSRDLTKSLIKTLEESLLTYDAVYLVRHRKLKLRFRHNYSQIFEDFNITDIKNSAILLTSIALTREEVKIRENSDLFYEESCSGCNKYNAIGMPIRCDESPEAPLCVLIPHFRISDEKISLLDLARFVYSIKTNCAGMFDLAEVSGQVKLPCEHQEVPVIPNKPIHDSRGTKYLLFLQFQQRKPRLPISRKISRGRNT